MFERFTDRARRVVVLAQEEARHLNHNYIGTEHLLAGLLAEGEGLASKVLEPTGLTRDGVRTQIEERIGLGQREQHGHIPFTPRAKQVIELSLREALQLGHNYIGTEHLLLGLIRVSEGLGFDILRQSGVELDAIRLRVIELAADRPVIVSQPAPRLAGTKYDAAQIRRILGGLLRASEALVADRWEYLHPASKGQGGARVREIYQHLSVPNLTDSACRDYAHELLQVAEALLITGISSLHRRLDLQMAIRQFAQDYVRKLDQHLLGPDAASGS